MDPVSLALEPSYDLENRAEGEFKAVVYFGFHVIVVSEIFGSDVTDSDQPNDHILP